MCLKFHLYLWCCIDSMEFVKTHILMDILCIESFGALIKNTIWYWSWKWCLYILHCENYWKGTIYFIPFICFFRVSNNSAWYTGEVLGVRFYFYWIFGFTHPSIHGASSVHDLPELVCLNISLTIFLHFYKLLWNQVYLSIFKRWCVFEYFTWKIVRILISCCEHRDTEVSLKNNLWEEKLWFIFCNIWGAIVLNIYFGCLVHTFSIEH